MGVTTIGKFQGDLEMLTEVEYCVNCIDVRTKARGTFVYDVNLFNQGEGLCSISPVFDDVMSFFHWVKGKGFKYHRLDKMFTVSRNFS